MDSQQLSPLYIVANGAIALSYFWIGGILLRLSGQLYRPGFRLFYWVLAAFILGCGFGHGLDAVGSPWAMNWHPLTAFISVSSAAIITKHQQVLAKVAVADNLNERVLSLYPNPVGLYQAVNTSHGDDLLILYQNPAAIARLGADHTGELLGKALPSHRETTPYNRTPLLDTYLQVAQGGADIERDIYYPGDSVAGWYRLNCFAAGPSQVLITWMDTSGELINEIQAAIDSREFVLHYQPIICLTTGATFGYEALIRWPKEGVIRQPGEFLPAIEKTELMSALCYLVVDMACTTLRQWATTPGWDGLRLAINVHPLTVGLDDFEAQFNAIVDGAGIDRALLVLEIGEQDLLKSSVFNRLERLHATGHPLEIDDWGTGSSSFVAAILYPVSGVKIDRALVDGIADNRAQQETVRFVLKIARLRGWHIVAEGVERVEDAEYLAAAGVDYGQGFYWSKPGPLE